MSQGVEGQHVARRERVNRAMTSRGSKAVRHKNAALEGLRALAIIGIVLYHMRPSMLQGGFLGVTVFFVLTGFLIRAASCGLWQTGRSCTARISLRGSSAL